MKFSVCVPSVRSVTLLSTVRSIIGQTWSDWELLVVGQGDDPTMRQAGEQIEALDERVHYVHLDQRGISRARNAGLRAATGDILAMTDDDCEAAPDWLASLAALFTAHPEVGVVGGALIAPPVSRWKLESCLSFAPAEAIYYPATESTPPPGWGWIGANFAVRASVAKQIGDFDESLGVGAPVFPAGEDTDYTLRLVAAGVPMLSSPAPVVYHTYGVRRGVTQNWRTTLAYARGNGGVDGKLTLAGDPHGEASASQVVRQGLRDAVKTGRLHRAPIVLMYGLTYQAAYRECVRDYTLDATGALVRTTPASPKA